MKKILSIILAIFLFAGLSNAQDVFQQSVTTDYGPNYVLYTGNVDWSDVSDSTYNMHTKPMFIGAANQTDGYYTNYVTNYAAASDFLVYFHFSNDLTTWVKASSIDGDMDQDAAGATVSDTLGQINGANDLLFHNYNWLILEFDGQAANPLNAEVDWQVRLQLPSNGSYNIPSSVAKTAIRATSNP